MKIYTKGGDSGQTSLIGGRRVSKTDRRIEAYGTIDELMAFVAHVRDQLTAHPHYPLLLDVLDRLMTCASLLAADGDEFMAMLPVLDNSDIETLETAIDKMDNEIPPLKLFVLPGGHPAISATHIARTVCRRAERRVIETGLTDENTGRVIRYLNRLSDYLFTLSRHIAYINGIEEVRWIPKIKKQPAK